MPLANLGSNIKVANHSRVELGVHVQYLSHSSIRSACLPVNDAVLRWGDANRRVSIKGMDVVMSERLSPDDCT